MSAKVVLNLGSENDIELTLDYALKNGDMVMNFHDDEGEDYISDKISQFSSIDADDKDPLKLTLRGQKVERLIQFKNETEATEFWTTIQKCASLTLLPGPKRTFIITMAPIQHGIGEYIPLVNFLNKTITSTVKTVKNIVHGKELEIPKQEEVAETDGFKLGYIHQSLSDVQISDYNESLNVLPKHSIYNTKFSQKQLLSIWENALIPNANDNKAKMLHDYKQICIQWKTLTKGQWNHSYNLRNYVVLVENAIRQSSVLSKEPYDRITFDVLLSSMFC